MEFDNIPTLSSLPESRRQHILNAAFTVFARHGYRKTSINDIAQAAHVSRQGIYLYFPNKENLFQEVITDSENRSLASAWTALSTPGTPIEERVVLAFDEWIGKHFGRSGTVDEDLSHATRKLLANFMEEQVERFLGMVAEILEESGRSAAIKRCGLSPIQIARTLYATSLGLLTLTKSRKNFVEDVTTAVRIFCRSHGMDPGTTCPHEMDTPERIPSGGA